MQMNMKRKYLVFLFLFVVVLCRAQSFSEADMEAIYKEVKTPFKYGLVVAPQDNGHKIDCPSVFRQDGKWYMTYVIYNGQNGSDGRGYTTWMSVSDDLLHWKTVGCLLNYKNEGWDMNQRGGFPSLIDWNWNGSYKMQTYKGKHWMTYIGGEGKGYEAAQKPLDIGLAWTKDPIADGHEWNTLNHPLLSINDKDVQWWEKLVQYKSTVYLDPSKRLGKKLIMFYNAGGVNPVNHLKAERIGIALSKDMLHWQRLPLTTSTQKGNPVYFHESPGIITGDAQIVKFSGRILPGFSSRHSSFYVLFYYSAFNPSRKYDAYNTFAVSSDLLHWQDWTGKDLIFPSKSYDNWFAHKSDIVKSGGVVYHFYCAVNKYDQRGIAVATSVPMGCSELHFPEPDSKGVRTKIDMDQGWSVNFGKTSEDSITSRMGVMKVNLPDNLDDYYGYRQLKHGNLHGSATYSKEFTLQKKTDKSYFLQFEGVGTYATVILNGHAFSRTLVGRTTYTQEITNQVRDGKNTLRILVDHPAFQTASPWVCGGCSSEWGFSEGSQPFGIFRPVTLFETASIRVEPFGVHIWNPANCDSVYMETEVKNYDHSVRKIQVVSKLNQANGKMVSRLVRTIELQPGQTQVVRQQMRIDHPILWSLKNPYLYNLISMLKDEHGETIDLVSTPYGIRSISWPVHRKDQSLSGGSKDPGTFLLNGVPVFINGTCDYEHLFGGSHAFSHEEIQSRVKMMRQAGFNAFREAHQPHNLLYQQLFDQQGMLFWSQFSAHIWYDTSEFRTNFKRLLRQWIKERRNSPSVILWGLQNESVLPKDFAEECSAIIREMDPTCKDQRAITTCNGGQGTDWNVIQNWSGTYGGNPDYYARELKQPDQLLNGEYGAWRTLGLHGKARYSEESFTHLLAKKALLAESVKDSVCGHFQWIFVSHENPGRVQPDEALRRIDKVGPFNNKGLFSPWEQPTEAFYWYRNHYVSAETDTVTPTAADRNKDLIKGASGYRYLYRVNCGGDAYRDSYGQLWAQDDTIYSTSWAQRFHLNPFLASQGHITVPIHGTEDDSLFQYFRWGRQCLSYHFKVPEGNYRIELYFVEPWLGARYGTKIDCQGERIFDVAINDSTVVNDFDPWAEAGYAGACRKIVNVHSAGGQLKISFPEVKVGEAVIAAIAVAVKGDQKSDSRWTTPTLSGGYIKNVSYWRSQDTDTIAKYPKNLLPKDSEVFPSVGYMEEKIVESKNLHVWKIAPGVAREYALRFHYKNISGKAIPVRLNIIDSKGIVIQDREITFPATPDKYKLLNTTTGTMINAGHYRVSVAGAKGLSFKILEIQ